jgi:hypothetical protein
MADDRIHETDQLFLACVQEQDRFREALRHALRQSSVVEKVKIGSPSRSLPSLHLCRYLHLPQCVAR